MLLLAKTGAVCITCIAPRVPAQAAPPVRWEARVTTAPNPLPAGRCARIVVEIVDNNGYRRTQLQDGSAIDSRKFVYATSDTKNFQWRNGNPADGYICTDKSARAAKTTITITLPDGTIGKVDLAITPEGQTAPATVFAKQAPLWRPGLPGSAVAGGAAAGGAAAGGVTAGGTAAGGAAPAGGAANAPAGRAARGAAGSNGAPGAPASGAQSSVLSSLHTVVVQPLSLTGSYFVLAAQTVAVQQLALTGNYFVLAPQTVVVPPLALTGNAAPMIKQGAPVLAPKAARTPPPTAH